MLQLNSGNSELIFRLKTYLRATTDRRHTSHPMRFLQLDRHVQHSHDLSTSFSGPWAEYAASQVSRQGDTVSFYH